MKKWIWFLAFILAVTGAAGQWIKLNPGTAEPLSGVFFCDTRTGYVVGDHGLIIRTGDGGEHWQILNSGTAEWLKSVFFTGSDTGYVAGTEGTILITADGGNTWDRQLSGTTATLRSIQFIDRLTGYMLGPAELLKTTDGGCHWTVYPVDALGGELCSVYFTSADTGYIAGGSDGSGFCKGFVLRSTDGGVTWIPVHQSFDLFNSVVFPAPHIGYVSGTGGTILKTMDGGESWSSTQGEMIDALCFLDADRGYGAGSSGTIIKTMNGGEAWSKQKSGTSEHLVAICFPAEDTGFAVGGCTKACCPSSCTILKTTNGGYFPIGGTYENGSQAPPFVSPNPATAMISVTVQRTCILSFIDARGTRIYTGTFKAGTTMIGCAGWPRGCYVLRGDERTRDHPVIVVLR